MIDVRELGARQINPVLGTSGNAVIISKLDFEKYAKSERPAGEI